MIIEITSLDFINTQRPWFNLTDEMLSIMISTAVDTLNCPYFPEELKYVTSKMHKDLINEKIYRN
jgi:hypothetical protein